MNKPKRRSIAEDLRGLNQLTINATQGITDLIEALHHNVTRITTAGLQTGQGRTRGLTGFIYHSVRAATQVVGRGIDAALEALSPHLGIASDRVEREDMLSAVNGIVGDHLHSSNNPLAISMQFRHKGIALELASDAIARTVPVVSGRIVILVHGLCMNDRQWTRKRRDGVFHNHGSALQEEFGVTPIYLHYNTGLPISENGRLFDLLIEDMVNAWPVAVEEITIIAHSMGGLVTRSAHHHAHAKNRTWRKYVRRAIFLGTPHQGAPLERGGHWIELILGMTPFAAPFARIGRIRSAGITDLRHGHSTPAFPGGLALPADIICLAIAGQIGKRQNAFHKRLIGDGLVPVDSALGWHADSCRSLALPDSNRVVLKDVNHLQLLSDRSVYEAIKKFMS